MCCFQKQIFYITAAPSYEMLGCHNLRYPLAMRLDISQLRNSSFYCPQMPKIGFSFHSKAIIACFSPSQVQARQNGKAYQAERDTQGWRYQTTRALHSQWLSTNQDHGDIIIDTVSYERDGHRNAADLQTSDQAVSR